MAIEPLGGGITNRNFKVEADGRTFVLRIGGRDTELLGIDRSAEYAASSVAADLGLGPEVVAYVEPEGYLVTRYVDGEVGKVDVEVTSMTKAGRKVTRVAGVDPNKLPKRALVVKTGTMT